MKLSVVTTLYNSSNYIYEFYDRISEKARAITSNYEIIFVDDGSHDDSLQKALQLHENDVKVRVVELSRNFGHHKAIMTGLSYAKGDYVFLIDSDLEEDPELLSEFWKERTEDVNVDVVYGVQEKRKGGWFERWSGKLYMNGRALFTFTATIIPKHISQLLEKNNFADKDIDKYVLHQGSKYIVDTIRKRLKADESKVVFDMYDYGNTVSSSIPIILEKELSKNSNRIVISGFGVGLSWASAILERK